MKDDVFKRSDVFMELDRFNQQMGLLYKMTGVPAEQWEIYAASRPEVNAFSGASVSSINNILKLLEELSPLEWLPKTGVEKILEQMISLTAIQKAVDVLNQAKECDLSETETLQQLNALEVDEVEEAAPSFIQAKFLFYQLVVLLKWAVETCKNVLIPILYFLLNYFTTHFLDDHFYPDHSQEQREQIIRLLEDIKQNQLKQDEPAEFQEKGNNDVI